jgi:multidrug efflux pump subunit AcrB
VPDPGALVAAVKTMLQRFLANHVLANLTFVLVLVVGTMSFLQLPREKDPTINFNWIQVMTALPGASAEDVEKLVTEPLEDAIQKVSDIKFISSTSREGVSSILVRFEDIDERTFDRRLNDLRREVQNKENQELPPEAESPYIFEVTTANAFPTATLVVSGRADDENLRRQARLIKQDLERLRGVDQVGSLGLHEPELQVLFWPERLGALGITASDLADTVRAVFRDTSAGTAQVQGQQWLVRLVGTSSDPGYLARIPVMNAGGEVPLASLAEVVRGRQKPVDLVRYDGEPAVLLTVMKQAGTNTLALVDRINRYLEQRNALADATGVELVLLDDQTEVTRQALSVMQTNALLGLLLVLLVTWIFLGSRIALLIAIGIPFTLAGTFWVLSVLGQTLNNSVLLGVVIALGMLVDDAVVVVEAVYYRLRQGVETARAVLEALREVFAPVTAAVLTTIAAFLPLMLLPGIVGQFMLVIPLVVTTALAISLVQAYWMLPAHVTALGVNFRRPSRVQRARVRMTHWIQVKYGRALIRVLRWPRASLLVVALLFTGALGAVGAGLVHVNFFAMDTLRIYYVNVEMPPGTPLEETVRTARVVEERVLGRVREGEVRATAAYAGQMFTETEPHFGDHYGQVMVSLNPWHEGLRTVDEMIEAMRADIVSVPGPLNVSFLRISDGPPTTKPINVKVRGDDFTEIRAAADALQGLLAAMRGVHDISDDDAGGRMELTLRLDHDAVLRAGLNPAPLARIVRMLVDGEVVAHMQHQGEKVEVRVRARPETLSDVQGLLRQTVALPDGGRIALSQLVHHETAESRGNIRHYNLRRTITVEADIDKELIDTVTVNRNLLSQWHQLVADYPGIALDFSGELDDIQESLDAMGGLFLLGIGLIYLILGTQFRSYFQPLMILTTVPLAFTGVVLGLLITRNPLSLYTLYGVVALGGIAVNSAIVLISAANARLAAGMSVLHATVYAARRRVIPILITSLTTIAGLFSLATGLGGHSLVWGPVATAIVWGLGFSTLLTLFVIPLLYRFFMGRSRLVREREQLQAQYVN